MRRSVIFAYTVKGYGLPMAGDPLNHSQLLTQAQMDELRDAFGIARRRDLGTSSRRTPPPGPWCAEAAKRLADE